MTNGERAKLLEAMKNSIEDLDEASACLDAAPENFEISSVKLMLQIPERKEFVFLDNNSVWIATSVSDGLGVGTFLKATINLNPVSVVKNQAKLVRSGVDKVKGSKSFKYKSYSLTDFSSIMPLPEDSFSRKLEVSKIFRLVFIDNKGKIGLKLPFKFKEVEKLTHTSSLILEAWGKDRIKFGGYLGSLEGENIIDNLNRKGWTMRDSFTEDLVSSLDIWENILITKLANRYKSYQMTHDVKAELYSNGELTLSYVTNRFGSASHGSVGLNLVGAALNAPSHDKKKIDSRSLRVQIIGSNWVVAINLDPKNLNQARTLVTQINRNLEVAKTESIPNETSNNSTDISDSLAKLADLKSQGLLSDEEFETAKARLLK
jgi:hypothetical protein